MSELRARGRGAVMWCGIGAPLAPAGYCTTPTKDVRAWCTHVRRDWCTARCTTRHWCTVREERVVVWIYAPQQETEMDINNLLYLN